MVYQDKKRFLINFLYILVVGGLTVICCRFLLVRMFPFLLAVIIAALAQKPAKFLNVKTHIPKPCLAVVLSAGIYIGVAALLIFLVWRLVMSSAGIIDFLPVAFERVNDAFQKIEAALTGVLPQDYTLSLSGVLDGFLKTLTEFLTDTVKKVIKAAPTFLLSSIVALVAGCYISKDYDGLARFVKSLCKKPVYDRFLRIKNIFTKSVFKIIKGYLILMLLTFFEVWLGLTALRVKKAYLIAAVIAVVDFLPVLGTGAIMIPWAIYSAVSSKAAFAVSLSVLYIIITLVRNFAEPKIVSQQIGISPLFILISMFMGLRIFGGAGLIIFPLILIVTVKYYKEDTEI